MNIRLVRVLAWDKKSKKKEREREKGSYGQFLSFCHQNPYRSLYGRLAPNAKPISFFFFHQVLVFMFFLGISFSPIITFTYCNSVLLQQKVKKNNIAVHVN